MRVTIMKDDNTVTVDGLKLPVDCSTLPANFHVLQWYGTEGEIEYSMIVCQHCNARSKKGNETITDLTPYNSFVEAWKVAKIKAEQEAAAREVALKEAQQKAIEAGQSNAAGPKN